MASLTIGSVGDLIAICGLLIDAITALSDSQGSAKKYKCLKRELSSLRDLLEVLETTLDDNIDLRFRDNLKSGLDDCYQLLKDYTKDIEPYGNSLGENPSAGKLKQIYKKLRWLSKKDDVAAFHQSVALYVSNTAAILALSGIDLATRCHQITTKQIAGGISLLQREMVDLGAKFTISNEEISAAVCRQEQQLQQIQDRQTTHHEQQLRVANDIIAAVQQNGRALFLRSHAHEDQNQSKHEEFCARFDRLELSINSKHEEQCSDDWIVINQELLEANRVLVRQILGLLFELSRLGLAGACTLLRILRFLLQCSQLCSVLRGNNMIFEDAIFRKFSIDVDFMSYHGFLQLLADKFEGTPGATTIKLGRYSFQDDSLNIVSLANLWPHGTLKGMKVSMRAQITIFELHPVCQSCGLRTTATTSEAKEFECECGVFISPSVARSDVWGPHAFKDFMPFFPGSCDELERAHSFFKRIEMVMIQNPSVCPYPGCHSRGFFKRKSDLRRHVKTQHKGTA